MKNSIASTLQFLSVALNLIGGMIIHIVSVRLWATHSNIDPTSVCVRACARACMHACVHAYNTTIE